MRPKFGLRDATLAVALIAFAMLITIQGRKIANLESKVQRLQKQNIVFNQQNVQVANTMNRFTQSVREDQREFHRTVEGLKKQLEQSVQGPAQ